MLTKAVSVLIKNIFRQKTIDNVNVFQYNIITGEPDYGRTKTTYRSNKEREEIDEKKNFCNVTFHANVNKRDCL